MPSFSAVLLTGGQSSRMGRDKALLPMPGSDLLLWQWQLRTLEELRPEAIFWSGPSRPGLPGHVRIISDTVEKAGPLAGISACLNLLQSDLLVALAIDLPRMNALFLKKMLVRCSSSCGVAPQHGDFFEPLAAIYPKGLAVLAAEHLLQERFAMQDLIREAVRRGLLQAFPLDEKDVPLFKNLNSPADLQDGFLAMYLRIALLFFLLLGQRAVAEVVPFYIATSQGIYQGSLDSGTGKLGTLTLAAVAKNPNFLALSPDDQFLFAALSDTVGSFQVQADGTLNSLNERPSGGATPCHVSVDKTGRHLFVANYDGGDIASFRVGPDGVIGDRTAFVPFNGSGPDPKRQTKSYAHSVYVDPQNKFVYACDLGSDSVWIFKFDPGHGSLLPADPPAAKVPPGSGPRHLAFHPDGKFVYVINEMGLSITVFARDATGALTALETVPTLPAGTPTKNVTAAEICYHPSGKWLYVSNRGADTISVFAIAPDGKLILVHSISSVAEFPRSFAIDPTGRWLIAAGQKDNRIVVLKIDPATGQLAATDQSAAVGAPVCVLFVPKK